MLAGIRTEFPLLGLVWVDGGYVDSVGARLLDRADTHERVEIVCRRSAHTRPRTPKR